MKVKELDRLLLATLEQQRIAKSGRVDDGEIIDRVIAENGPVMDAAKDALFRDALRARLKALIRQMEDEIPPEWQISLLPEKPPRWIRVPRSAGGYELVEYVSATLSDLQANVDMKQRKRDEFDEKLRCDRANLEAMRPLLLTDPTMTVGEALRQLRGGTHG